MKPATLVAEPFFRTDCRLYRGSSPCAPHKRDGRACAGCDAYAPIGESVLIIKLGASGDVLRTTAVLADIAAAHIRPAFTWITRPESLPLLDGNPLIYRAIATDEAVPVLLTQAFDAIYTLDCDTSAAALSRLARTTCRRGYRAGPNGTVVGVEPGGDDTLYRIGLSDPAKRANRQSYLKLLLATCGLQYTGSRPFVAVDPTIADQVRAELATMPRPWVGVNPGAAPRWQRKRWASEHVAGLVAMQGAAGMTSVLFGTGSIAHANVLLMKRAKSRVYALESEGSLAKLCAAISLLDVLVTTDSLAMHIAYAVGTPVVALFGPTSSAEIDLAPGDIKLSADMPCLGCYLPTCSIEEHCMKRLTSATVFNAVERRLASGAGAATPGTTFG